MFRVAGCARPPSGRWTAWSAIPPSSRASRPRPARRPSCSAASPGCWPGAFSMALGEYTSVTTANEQIDSEVRVERRSFRKHPQAETAELVAMLMDMGMTRETAEHGHRRGPPGREPRAELPPRSGTGRRPPREAFAVGRRGLVVPHVRDRRDRPPDPVPARIRIAVGGARMRRDRPARRGRACGEFHPRSIWFASLRQLAFGAVAIAATYLVGSLVDTVLYVCVVAGILVCALPLSCVRPAVTTPAPSRVCRSSGRCEFPTTTCSTTRPSAACPAISYDPGRGVYYVISDDRSEKNPARFYTVRITFPDNRLGRCRVAGHHLAAGSDRQAVRAAVARRRHRR